MSGEQLFGLIGGNLKNTFSQDYFNAKFQKNKLPYLYKNFPLDTVEQIIDLIGNNPSLQGLNVTIPFKENILPLLHSIDASAKEVGAVNCIKINRMHGQLHLKGFNTDIYGFKESLLSFIPTTHKLKCLIIGTGGAAKAVAYVCSTLHIEFLFITHHAEKANKNTIYAPNVNAETMLSHQLIVNCTPLGMYPQLNAFPTIPYALLNESHYCFDLIYLPSQTVFLQKADGQNAKTKNGLEMLHKQADKAFEIFMQEQH